MSRSIVISECKSERNWLNKRRNNVSSSRQRSQRSWLILPSWISRALYQGYRILPWYLCTRLLLPHSKCIIHWRFSVYSRGKEWRFFFLLRLISRRKAGKAERCRHLTASMRLYGPLWMCWLHVNWRRCNATCLRAAAPVSIHSQIAAEFIFSSSALQLFHCVLVNLPHAAPKAPVKMSEWAKMKRRLMDVFDGSGKVDVEITDLPVLFISTCCAWDNLISSTHWYEAKAKLDKHLLQMKSAIINVWPNK